jgi:hypothetical protein
MPSTDIDGTPLLILRLPDVKLLYQIISTPKTSEQYRILGHIIHFLECRKCIEWEKTHDTTSQ